MGHSLAEASVAPSCLIGPKAGDEILLYQEGPEAYILAILRRDDQSGEALLELPPKARLTSKSLTIDSPSLSAKSERIDVSSAKVSLAGSLLAFDFSIFQLAGRIMTSVFRSVFCRSRETRLEVEETAAINAGRVTLMGQEEIIARTGILDLQAKDSVKIDGRSIRLG